MSKLPVTFYHPSSRVWREVGEMVDDRSSFAWVVQENWIVQTYLILRDAGYPVSLSKTLPLEGMVVFSPDSRFALRRAYDPVRHRHLVLVSARGDLFPIYSADFEIVQNGRYADGRRQFFIPHWPQPGLVPRDQVRSTRIRTAAYMGGPVNLDPGFRSDLWRDFLHDRGIEWHLKEQPDQLQDYSDVDLVLAVRRCRTTFRFKNKPASKLVNAWAAGVPALLGKEYAYRELRRSNLDYIEVGSVQDAMQAVRRLQEDPALYEAMVRNGCRRWSEYTPDRMVERWAELLFDTIPSLASSRSNRLRGVPLRVRGAGTFLRHPSFGGYPPRMLAGKLLRWVRKRFRKLTPSAIAPSARDQSAEEPEHRMHADVSTAKAPLHAAPSRDRCASPNNADF